MPPFALSIPSFAPPHGLRTGRLIRKIKYVPLSMQPFETVVVIEELFLCQQLCLLFQCKVIVHSIHLEFALKFYYSFIFLFQTIVWPSSKDGIGDHCKAHSYPSVSSYRNDDIPTSLDFLPKAVINSIIRKHRGVFNCNRKSFKWFQKARSQLYSKAQVFIQVLYLQRDQNDYDQYWSFRSFRCFQISFCGFM